MSDGYGSAVEAILDFANLDEKSVLYDLDAVMAAFAFSEVRCMGAKVLVRK